MKETNDTGYSLKSRFTDFLIFTALFALVFGGIFFTKALLWGKSEEPFYLIAQSEKMSDTHSGKLAPDDTVYDTVTKRAIGKIESVLESNDGGNIYYTVSIRAVRRPKGKALRTEKLWFYFKEVVNE